MKILILHPGGLGDVILSLPAVALLRDKFPKARITIAGNIDHLVPVMSTYTESAISLSRLPLHQLYSSGIAQESDVEFWRAFDLIVSWTGGGDPEFTRKFRLIHPDVRIAAWKPSPQEEKHVSQLFVDSLNLGSNVAAKATPAPIILHPELRAAAKDWLVSRGWNGRDPLTALHPGAGSRVKRWPAHRFVRLAEHLAVQEKTKILIIEGAAERGLSKQIVPELPADRLIVFDEMSLDVLAAVIAQCNLFVGNDSGVAHLAAALNVRSIVIFGPTLPRHWAPLGRDVTILRNTSGCEGCASGGNNHTCLENITVEQVLEFATRKPGPGSLEQKG